MGPGPTPGQKKAIKASNKLLLNPPCFPSYGVPLETLFSIILLLFSDVHASGPNQ